MGPVHLDAPPSVVIRAVETLAAMMVAGGLLVVAIRALRKRPKEAAAPGVPLGKRYLTLMALVVLVLGPAFAGGWIFVAGIAVIAALATTELFGALDPAARSLRIPALVTTVAVVVATAIAGVWTIGPVIGLGLVLIAVWGLRQGSDRLVERAGGAALAALYVGVTCAFMASLRQSPRGFGRYLYFLVVIQMADLGGLFGGMALGKHKLAPVLSPGKTWEGSITGLVAAAGGGALFAFAVPDLGLPLAAAIAVPLAVAGAAGDLFASGLKRSAGLKDFGAILPGHGGILDRFDGYLLAAPVAWAAFALLDRFA